MIHEIKIQKDYADRIIDGVKKFEVRKNDRDYQRGDYLKFIVMDGIWEEPTHKLTGTEWKIIYIHTGLGMQPDYVILGIERIVDTDNKEELNKPAISIYDKKGNRIAKIDGKHINLTHGYTLEKE